MRLVAKPKRRPLSLPMASARVARRMNAVQAAGKGSTMIERFTRSASRNIFYGGSAFFLILFVGLTAHSHFYIRNTSTDAAD